MADVAINEGGERKIVVAVDESEESIYALQWCLCNLLPARAQNTLVLLYARPPPPTYSVLDGTESTMRRHHYTAEMDYIPNWEVPQTGYVFLDEVISSMDCYSKDVADSVLKKAENICKSYNNIKIDVKSCSGDARGVICETVERLGADLLVMGSHGYGFIKRALIGSVSDYCARNAKCPVLIVKRPAQ